MSSASSENKNMHSRAQPKRYRDANWVPGAKNKHTKYRKVDMYDREYKSSGAATADEEELKQEESDSDYKGDESASGSESESEDEGDEDEGDESESESEGNGITDQDDPNFEWGKEGEEWEWVDESIDDE
jgi:hypothetical protein